MSTILKPFLIAVSSLLPLIASASNPRTGRLGLLACRRFLGHSTERPAFIFRQCRIDDPDIRAVPQVRRLEHRVFRGARRA